MNYYRVWAIILRQLFLLRHNLTRFSNIFFWIILDIVLWGFITKYLNVVGSSGFSFVPVLLGAVILWNFLIRVQQGVMLAFFEDLWTQNFLNLFASPLSVKEYISGLVATSIITSSAGFLAMIILAGIFFGFNIFILGLGLFPFLLILFLFGLALGIFSAALVLRIGPSAEWLAWPLPFVINPFVGVFYPLSVLPAAMQIIGSVIPISYVFEGMRSVVLSGTFSWNHLIIGALLAIVYLLLSYYFFLSIYRLSLRKGLISRFSAEGGSF